MKMKKYYFITMGCILIGGCAVKKEMVPMGGSKADGTVRMGYTVAGLEKPIIDFNQAKDLASKKCRTWGYEGAEPFGGQSSTCAQMSGFGCQISNVTVEYQCVGGKASQN